MLQKVFPLLQGNPRNLPLLEVIKPLLKCIDREEVMQKETAGFPVLCPTQISSTTANFKAGEGRKHDSNVSAIPNTVGVGESKCLSWKNLSQSDCSVLVWKLTALDGGTMAYNETNPFWLILKSINYGKCFCFVVKIEGFFPPKTPMRAHRTWFACDIQMILQ